MTGRESYASSGNGPHCEESTHLLSSNHDGDDWSSDNNSNSASSFAPILTTRQKWKIIWEMWKIPILCYIFALLVDGGDTLRSTPKTRLLESIICNRYFAETLDKGNFTVSLNDHWLSIPEEQCKAAPVQAELVTLKAWFSVGESILGALYMDSNPFAYLPSIKFLILMT